MGTPRAKPITIKVNDTQNVSGLLDMRDEARVCFVFAHGAGAGMSHPFMAAIATGLANRGIATLRYQFPYMERGSKRPDTPGVAHAAVRAAVAAAAQLAPDLPLIAGGKSFGGRMTSQVQAILPLAAVRGLAFLGFPLHPAKKPSNDRAQHLFDVKIPMLFLQGTRDALAELPLMTSLVEKLGPPAKLKLFPGADHSFHVAGGGAGRDAAVMNELLDTFATWTTTL